MNGENRHFYRFKSFRLDVEERRLLQNNLPVPLTPKAFDVLAVLVECSGHLVEKDELLRIVWADSFVEEANIARIIHTLRKTLGEDGNGNKFIETVAKKGYRFVAEVNEVCEKPNSRQSAVAVGSQDGANEQLPSAFRQLPTETPAGGSGLETASLIVKPKQNTRIILFAIGFVSAVFLIFLLSFNFQSASSVNPNVVKSIAVLPLKPITVENREPIYEFGIADSLILKLGSAKGLIVRPLSATRRYADIEQDAIAAGREQKTDYVLASNYQIADGKIRITSQLINVQSGQVEEVFKVEQENSSIFAVQDAVAANIGGLLLKKLNREPNNLLAKRGTNNEEAYRLYLRGHFFANQETTEGFQKALEHLNKAVELDSNYALAYTALSRAYHGASEWYLPPREAMPKAKFYAEHALRLDETLPEAHAALGWVKMNYEWDWAGAESEFKRALELDPNHGNARISYSWLLSFTGRHQEAIAEAKRGEEMKPLAYPVVSFFLARQFDQAISQANKSLEITPNSVGALQWLGLAYEQKGMYKEAFAVFQKARQIENTPDMKAFQARTNALMGKSSEALKTLAELKELSKQRYISPYFIAIIHAGLNEKGEAFRWLEKAYEDRSYWIAGVKSNPQLDSLRDDPRFDELVSRVGLK